MPRQLLAERAPVPEKPAKPSKILHKALFANKPTHIHATSKPSQKMLGLTVIGPTSIP